MGSINPGRSVVFLWYPPRELKKETEDGGFGRVFTACAFVSLLWMHTESQRTQIQTFFTVRW